MLPLRGNANDGIFDIGQWPDHLDIETAETEEFLLEVLQTLSDEYSRTKEVIRATRRGGKAALSVQRVWRGHQARKLRHMKLEEIRIQIQDALRRLQQHLDAYNVDHLPLTLSSLAAMTPAQQAIALREILKLDDERCREFLALLTTLPPQQQQKQQAAGVERPRHRPEAGRVALVMCNRQYSHIDGVPPPPPQLRELDRVAETFAKLGFFTLHGTDLTLSAMRELVTTMSSVIAKGTVVAVYYAGVTAHSAGGEHFLVPVDSPPLTTDNIDFECLPLKSLYDDMTLPPNVLPLTFLRPLQVPCASASPTLKGIVRYGVAPCDLTPPRGGFLLAVDPVAGADRWHGLQALLQANQSSGCGYLDIFATSLATLEGIGDIYYGPHDKQYLLGKDSPTHEPIDEATAVKSIVWALQYSQESRIEEVLLSMVSEARIKRAHIGCDYPPGDPPFLLHNDDVQKGTEDVLSTAYRAAVVNGERGIGYKARLRRSMYSPSAEHSTA